MKTRDQQSIYYDPRFVRGLFDEMANTYGIVNMVSSFGFAYRWRRQCVDAVSIKPGTRILDLMTGMGELCPNLSCRMGPSGSIVAIDISPNMCAQAKTRIAKQQDMLPVSIIEANALDCPIDTSSVDYDFSSFGLKTFSDDQQTQLAHEIYRVLKPGGAFSLLEISVPRHWWLRMPYMFYLHRVISLIGKVALGNPDNYRLLGTYTSAFQDCGKFHTKCEGAGLLPQSARFFMGCATGVHGIKPGAT